MTQKLSVLILLIALLGASACTSTGEESDGAEIPAESDAGEQDSAQLDIDTASDEPSAQEPFAAPPPSDLSPPTVQGGGPQDGSTPRVQITNLEYRAVPEGGVVVINTTQEARYVVRKNPQDRQVVVEVQNAVLPAKLKRPYNTREFPGPIQGFQAYQNTGGSTARVVVQMRTDTEPEIAQVGNRIELKAVGRVDAPVSEAADETLTDSGGIGATPSVSLTPTSDLSDPNILGNKNFDAFLTGQTKFYGKPISIQVKDADIRDVFNLIAEESGLNIVLSEGVKGKTTLKLKRIPWDQALVVLMKSNQLGYVRQGTILRIAPLKEIKDENDQARSVLEAQRSLTPMRVKIFPISYAKAEELVAQATGFLSIRGRISADKRTNSLIVTDIDENLTRIARLVDDLDTQTPQVLIEARIVEARQDFQRQAGLQWSLTTESIPLGKNKGAPINLQAGANLVSSVPTGTGVSLNVGTIPVIGDLDARLSLYELESKVRVISSPKVMTLNGESATIEQTTDIPLVTQTVSNGVVTTQTTFKPLELKLTVRPQVAADGGILMDVNVSRQYLGAVTGGDQRAINKRSAQTKVLIDNGQTTVLGGIYQSDVAEGEEGLPGLRKIPILGALFRSNTYTREKNELLIFLTPRVVNADKVFSKTSLNGGRG